VQDSDVVVAEAAPANRPDPARSVHADLDRQLGEFESDDAGMDIAQPCLMAIVLSVVNPSSASKPFSRP
jgi:hypothetical protein